ncbi:DUF6941 family protein [Pseudooceanicola sp. 200-1SW]|uniref:DUF6941 family protein n=1 Tax=Pseudooceanicola sp. 200-1SW TaxID=3425949 RepID=UPI003D7F2993
MIFEPYGVATFCDDIRHEANGKITLVGCYAGELIFGSKAPAVLPTFAALISLRLPLDSAPKKVDIRVMKLDQGGQTSIMDMSLKDIDLKADGMDLPEGFSEEDRLISMMIPCQWQMLRFEGPGTIKARAYINDEIEVKLGALVVKFADHKDQDEKA